MTAAELSALIDLMMPLAILGVIFLVGVVVGWAAAKSKYDRKMFAEKAAMKAEARNELLWEMQRTQQAPPADGPVYRA